LTVDDGELGRLVAMNPAAITMVEIAMEMRNAERRREDTRRTMDRRPLEFCPYAWLLPRLSRRTELPADVGLKGFPLT